MLNLVIAPADVLLQMARPVEKVDDSVRELMDGMFRVMYENHGIGLAANQVGVLKRVIVVDVEHDRDKDENIINKKQYFMANPEVLSHSDAKSSLAEGCLSFPGERVEIERPTSIKVKFVDYDGNPQEIEATGLLATCIQHEIDHLNGVSISNYVSHLKRDMMFSRLRKYKKRIAFV